MGCQPLVVRLAGQPDHSSPGQPRQLNCDRSDSPGSPGHHDGVAFAQANRPDCGVGGGASDKQGPGHLPRHRRRLRGQVLGLSEHILGVAGPVVGEADNLIADCEARDLRARLRDDAGEVAAFARRENRREARMQQTVADLSFAGVDARRLDPYESLSGSWYRRRHLGHLQHVHAAVLIEPNCLHGSHSFVSADRDRAVLMRSDRRGARCRCNRARSSGRR